jgi:hypothetical protein
MRRSHTQLTHEISQERITVREAPFDECCPCDDRVLAKQVLDYLADIDRRLAFGEGPD